jgi:GNAT superfamily N-acetyltransferase
MSAVRILDGLSRECQADSVGLIFEYMAATLSEGGRPTPGSVLELPAVLRRECENLTTSYALPGALFVAYQDDRPVGCVGLSPGPLPDAVEVKRLYVRPALRTRGLGRHLMAHAHRHAEQHDFKRSVLDVLPTRGHVIDFYRRLGYAECEPFPTESPTPMVYMQRPTTSRAAMPATAPTVWQ